MDIYTAALIAQSELQCDCDIFTIADALEETVENISKDSIVDKRNIKNE